MEENRKLGDAKDSECNFAFERSNTPDSRGSRSTGNLEDPAALVSARKHLITKVWKASRARVGL